MERRGANTAGTHAYVTADKRPSYPHMVWWGCCVIQPAHLESLSLRSSKNPGGYQAVKTLREMSQPQQSQPVWNQQFQKHLLIRWNDRHQQWYWSHHGECASEVQNVLGQGH